MRILFICENYYPHFGGAEMLFQHLAEGYVQQGHQVTVLTHQMKGTTREEIMNGVQIRRIPSLFSRYVFTFAALKKAYILAKEHEIIQTTTFNGAPPAWIAARLRGKPIIITIHEVWQGRWQEITGFPFWKASLHEILERLLYLLPFDRYICVSQATKNDLLATGISPQKAVQIYNGFDHEEWQAKRIKKTDKQRLRKEWGWQNQTIFLACGRPGPSKGFIFLLRALAQVRGQLPDARLLLILGSPEKYVQNYQSLLQEIQVLHLQDLVKVITSLPYSQLKEYFAAADVVVVPSVMEGFGYTAVQAVAMGKPILASNAGSLPEVVAGKYLLFQNKNVANLAEKLVLISQGKWQEKEPPIFPWEKTIGEYLKVYEEAVQEKK